MTRGNRILEAQLREYGSYTVSEGTLKTGGLARKFAETLEALSAPERPVILDEIQAEVEQFNDWESYGELSLEAPEHVDALIDELGDFAPEGYYFGAHWGDGADFGFYPCEDGPEATEQNTDGPPLGVMP